MATVPIKLGVQSNPGRHDNSARLINAYAENAGDEAKIKFPLYAVDGLKDFAEMDDGGEHRGMIVLNDVLYVVSGRTLFKVESDGDMMTISGLPGNGPVYMARNRKQPDPQIAIVADGLKWILEADVLTPIADTDLPAPIGVVFLDGYFIWPIADGRFFLSAIDDGTQIDPLDFAEAEGNPDGLLRAIVRGRELWLFGPESTEVWANSGAADFPFERLPGAYIDKGCLSGASVALVDTKLIFVANDQTVVLVAGYDSQKISSNLVEADIARTEDKSLITAFAYSQRGHEYYVLKGPDFTHVYDLTLGVWHERASYGLTFWRAEGYANFANKHITGDYQSGKLYEIDRETFDEAGQHLVMTVRTPILQDYPGRIEVNDLYIDVVPGVGLNTADAHNRNPKMMLRVSKDSGKTWSIQREREIGAQGKFHERLKFGRLGTSKEDGFVLELSASAGVSRGITGAAAEVERLPA